MNITLDARSAPMARQSHDGNINNSAWLDQHLNSTNEIAPAAAQCTNMNYTVNKRTKKRSIVIAFVLATPMHLAMLHSIPFSFRILSAVKFQSSVFITRIIIFNFHDKIISNALIVGAHNIRY